MKEGWDWLTKWNKKWIIKKNAFLIKEKCDFYVIKGHFFTNLPLSKVF